MRQNLHQINKLIQEALGDGFYNSFLSNSTGEDGIVILKKEINISDYPQIINSSSRIMNDPLFVEGSSQAEIFIKTISQIRKLKEKIENYSNNLDQLAKEEFVSQGKNIMHHILSLKDNKNKFKKFSYDEKEQFLNSQLSIWTNAYKQNYFKSINENFNNFEDRMVSNVVYHTLIEYNEIST